MVSEALNFKRSDNSMTVANNPKRWSSGRTGLGTRRVRPFSLEVVGFRSLVARPGGGGGWRWRGRSTSTGSWRRRTGTTASCSMRSCRVAEPPGGGSPGRCSRGFATTSVATFSTSPPAFSGASTSTTGSETFTSPKVFSFFYLAFFWSRFGVLNCKQ
ncbi:hypothetical protein GW17_00022146 [Ensete ventricosum]|nr:hypothetical protein GW17_00022146 [Ensete ventricosum]